MRDLDRSVVDHVTVDVKSRWPMGPSSSLLCYVCMSPPFYYKSFRVSLLLLTTWIEHVDVIMSYHDAKLAKRRGSPLLKDNNLP